MDRLLTMDEVAQQLRTPLATLRFWRHKGIGPESFKLGRRVVYTEDSVRAFIAAEQRRQVAS